MSKENEIYYLNADETGVPVDGITFIDEKPEYEIDYDTIRTIDDVKDLLKCMSLTVTRKTEENARFIKEVGSDSNE